MVGDIGGTNTRLALYDAPSGELTQVRAYLNSDFSKLEEVVARWLKEAESTNGKPVAVHACCLAIAAPPMGDQVNMLNVDWSFSKRAFAREFGFEQLGCINDFEGNAYALPHLQANELVSLRGDYQTQGKKCAVVGPGTGLGGATLDLTGTSVLASASEPGYAGLSPANDLEIELFRELFHRYDTVWAELLLSGPGLERLHSTLASVRGNSVEPLTAAQITEAALNGGDCHSRDVLKVFCALLGSACGDYVLTTGSYGGLFLAGGIVPRISDFLAKSEFLQRFSSKGKMKSVLSEVPVHLITCPTLGLLGAAHAPL
ncbi:MAG: glucokinase [Halioglobus sp.]